MHTLKVVLLAVTVAVPTLAANAGSTSKTGAAKTSKTANALNPTEVQTLAKLHQINQEEIKLGGLAKTAAQSQAVKSYGAHLVTDHTASDKQLQEFAKERGIEISEPQPKDEQERQQMAENKATAQKLESLHGEAFDQAFAPAMVKGHQEAVNFLTSVRGDIQDPKLKTLVDKNLTVIQNHLKMAQELSRNLHADNVH